MNILCGLAVKDSMINYFNYSFSLIIFSCYLNIQYSANVSEIIADNFVETIAEYVNS